MGFSYGDSYKKTLKQLSVVARKPFAVGDKPFVPPKHGLKITESFWRKYGCYLGCGGCCQAFTLDFLPFEWDNFCRLYPDEAQRGNAHMVVVNGEAKELVTISNEDGPISHERRWCNYLDMDSGACTIHAQNPLSCRLELIKFRVMRQTGYILKAPFGGGWNMIRLDGAQDVLCDFSDFSPTQFHENDLPRLRQLEAWARYFAIDTYLREVMDTLLICVESEQLKELSFHE